MQVLPLGLYAGFAPVASMACILLLRSVEPLRRAGAYVLGYVAAIIAVTAVAAFLVDVGSGAVSAAVSAWLGQPRPEPRTVRYVLTAAVGLVLLALAARRWRVWRNQPMHAYAPPRWLRVVDRIGAGGALGLGAALFLGNVDNVLVFLLGVNWIGAASVGEGGRLVAYAVLVLESAASVLAPMAIYLWRPAEAATRLDALAVWLARASGALVVGVLVAIGLWLIGIGLRGMMA